MRESFMLILSITMIVVELVMGVIALVKGQYDFAVLFCGLSSVQADMLRLQMKQEV